MWLQATVPAVAVSSGNQAAPWQSNVGHRLVKSAEVEVGGQRLDKHYADWLEVWSQLTVPSEKTAGYEAMIDQTENDTVVYAAVSTVDSGKDIGTSGTVTITNTDKDLGIGAYSITFTCKASNKIASVGACTFAGSAISNVGGSGSTTTIAGNELSFTVNLKGTTNNGNNEVLKTALNNGGSASIITISNSSNNAMIAFNGAVTGDITGAVAAKQLHVPLQFWFCRNPGCALPLIALQYHEVKVNLEFESFANCKSSAVSTASASLSGVSLWVDYVYLDTDERRRFAQVSHEYLIEQVQFTGDEAGKTTASLRLNFNHPVKELVWVGTTANAGVYSANLSNAKLQLNGHDRFAQRPGDYFNKVQPYQHHTNIPSGNVHVYSFALKPEEHQPSGTCNFSRIDNATLQQTWSSAPTKIKVFAVNYNVLRVMSGMGGLAYSN